MRKRVKEPKEKGRRDKEPKEKGKVGQGTEEGGESWTWDRRRRRK